MRRLNFPVLAAACCWIGHASPQEPITLLKGKLLLEIPENFAPDEKAAARNSNSSYLAPTSSGHCARMRW
jgi:hypothetical protein